MFHLHLAHGLTATLHERGHVDELFALIDANREHLSVWFDWPANTLKPEDLHGFVDGSLARFSKGEGFDAGLRQEGRLIGGISVHHVDRRVGRAEMGYWLANDAQGQGVMTRAVAGLVRHLVEDERFEKIEIRCHADNVRSAGVATRLGFTLEGTLRRVDLLRGQPIDHLVYGMLASEWNAQRARQEATA